MNQTGKCLVFHILQASPRMILTPDSGPYSNVSANVVAQLPLSIIAPNDYLSIATLIEMLDPSSLLQMAQTP